MKDHLKNLRIFLKYGRANIFLDSCTCRSIALTARLVPILWLISACGALQFVSAIGCHAQNVNLGDDVARPIPGAGHDYIHGLSETVNPANGNLSIRIDLPVPKARGLTFPYAITYNSGEVFRFTSMIPGCGGMTLSSCGTGTPEPGVSSGWSNTLPYVTYMYTQVTIPPYDAYCEMSSSYTFYDPQGGSHMLGLAGISWIQNPSPYNTSSDCARMTYNDESCGHFSSGETTGWEAGCTGGYPYDAFASGGDDQVHAQSDLCNGYENSNYPDCEFGRPAFTVTDTNGTVYYFSQDSSGGPIAMAYPTKIEDRNGNIIQVSPSGEFTDTAGRPLISSSSNGSTVGGVTFGATWGSAANANFSPASIQVDTPPSSNNLTCNASFVVNYPNVGGMTSLTLPNGQQYTFKYDPNFGLVNEIDYPDGGWVKYTWGLPTDSSGNPIYTELATFDALDDGGGLPPYYGACIFRYQTPVVLTRSVGYAPNSSAAQTQTFTYATQWAGAPQLSGGWSPLGSQPIENDPRVWSTKTTTVQTTDNVTHKTASTTYAYSYVYQPLQPNSQGQLPSELPVESSVTDYDWSGNLLQTVSKTWRDQFEMTSEQTALSGGLTAQTNYSYFNGFPENVYEKDEYDFGQGAPQSTPTRTTKYAYGFYTEPCRVVTYSGSSASSPVLTCTSALPSGTVVSESDAIYDGGSLSPVSGGSLPPGTHDPNYEPGSNAARGNPTTVIRCLSGTGPGCSGPTTTYSYDYTGQVVSKTEPCGNVACAGMPSGGTFKTTYSYTDSPSGGNPAGNSNAYVTQITRPAVNTSHIEKFQYNYVTGFLTEASDENNQPTDYTYSDPLNRLTLIQGPPDTSNGNLRPTTTIQYNDASGSASITTTVAQTPNPSRVSVQTFDGMGHVVQSQLTSDVSTDYTNTSFDGMGNVYQQSTPTRCSSSPGAFPTSCSESTWGITTFNYDALGRKTVQINADDTPQHPSRVQWSYSGDAINYGLMTTFTDENDNVWKRTSDGLGRLINVTEPGGLTTRYAYDTLDNLLSVNQLGNSGSDVAHNRSFTYDALSRLVCASNPENSTASCPTSATGSYVAGTTGYAYDANGNLQSKTAPQPSASAGSGLTTTTNYTYDPLNRLTAKTYTNAPAGTLSACYAYDTSTNGVGRLAAEWTGGSCASTSGAQTMRLLLAYSTMGRILNEQQCVNGQCTQANPVTPPCNQQGTNYLPYCYDLAGNLIFYTNGLPSTPGLNAPLTFTNTFDGAGRLSTLSSSWNDSTHPSSLFTSQGYTPAGAIQQMLLGNKTTVTKTYDDRLRSTVETSSHQ